jgi:hypothetical protein
MVEALRLPNILSALVALPRPYDQSRSGLKGRGARQRHQRTLGPRSRDLRIGLSSSERAP